MALDDFPEHQKNLEAFEKALPKLLKEGERGYALVGPESEITCWDTWKDALQVGYDSYGLNNPFIVQEIIDPRYINNVAA